MFGDPWPAPGPPNTKSTRGLSVELDVVGGDLTDTDACRSSTHKISP